MVDDLLLLVNSVRESLEKYIRKVRPRCHPILIIYDRTVTIDLYIDMSNTNEVLSTTKRITVYFGSQSVFFRGQAYEYVDPQTLPILAQKLKTWVEAYPENC
jgi:hypothetical protein